MPPKDKVMKKIFGRTITPQIEETIRYAIIGVTTSIIGVGTFLAANLMGAHYSIANTLSWVISVTFAWVANSTWVFPSGKKTFMGKVLEAWNFYISRLASGLAEMALLYVFIDLAGFMDFPSKIVASMVVVVLNYLFMKFWVFKSSAVGGNGKRPGPEQAVNQTD